MLHGNLSIIIMYEKWKFILRFAKKLYLKVLLNDR